MARSLLIDAAGVVFLVRSIGTPPCPRKKRMLRSIFLIARPPLLAVMRGGEFALLKMAPNLDSCAFEEGWLRRSSKITLPNLGAAGEVKHLLQGHL
jgi:hypothetical protein